jgi:hypothetical protein
MIYRYYYFNRLKQRHPHMSFCELLHWTWRWTFLGPPPEPKSFSESDRGSSNASKRRRPFFSKKETLEEPAQAVANQDIVGSKCELFSMNFPSISTNNDSAIVEDNDHVNVLVDEFLCQEQPHDEYLLEFFSADLLMSYGDFPNTLSEEPLMAIAQFPIMIGLDSNSAKPTSGFANATRDNFSQPHAVDHGNGSTI